MPDLIVVFERRWKMIVLITVLATIAALVAALLSPKKYLSVATALPANSVTSDKARIFNNNIEALYSDLGSSFELDRLEGTAVLDTIFLAASKDLNLAGHYLIEPSPRSIYDAAMLLKKNTSIEHSAYGELKVRVWDKSPVLAAELANTLLDEIQLLHQHLQAENNVLILQKIKDDYKNKEKQYKLIGDSLRTASVGDAELWQARKAGLTEQLVQYEKLADQYQLAINANSPVLLTVEKARPSLYPDKPQVIKTVLFSFFAAFLFSFLLGLFIESRKL